MRQLYTTPSSPKLFRSAPASYCLYGLTGQMYQHGHLPFTGGQATLDLSRQPSGSYILVLEAGERRYWAKVVVE